jgi:hypothetical protein
MALQPGKDIELATGYRLVERLGAGGYGEVWKAVAPGGLTKAVKIVFGAMDGPQAEQELKALGRIKEVRHPFLLSLERIDVLDGQLFVVMELAEGSLADRYHLYQRQGQRGIPREELLSHLRDAAEALDYMSHTHGLQHLDVKPQNLLLVGGRIKVADFGQVRYLGGVGSTAPGVTPVYATPEAFDGRVSRHSDQYSLAVVYQEMLTGARPFPGTTMMQLAAQHIGCQPSLAPLPPGDRPAISRALAKVPEHRFPSCLKMVEALLAAPKAEALPPAGPSESMADLDTRAGVCIESTPPENIEDSLGLPEADGLRETLIPTVAPAAAPVRRERFEPLPGVRQGFRPTLFLGVGGLAGAVLRRLKKRLREKYSDLGRVPSFGFLLLDTDRDDLRRVRQDDSSALDSAETLLTPLHPPEHYRQSSRHLLRWLDRRWLYGIPRSLLTRGLRPLGRLALVDNAPEVLARLREALARVTTTEAVAATAKAMGSGIRDETPRVFVLASVTGGTGGGMLVSLAYGIRQVLGDLGLSAGGLCALLLHATGSQAEDRETARVNTAATLNELDLLDRPGVVYPGEPESGLAGAPAGLAPFEERYVVHLGDGMDHAAAEAATDVVGDYLYFDACADGGACLDLLRARAHAAEPGAVRTFGLARVDRRGERSDDSVARLLCRQLMERWLAEPDAEQVQALQRQAQREVVTRGLEEKSLILALQMAVNTATGNRPDAFIPQTLARAAAIAGTTRPAQMLGFVDAAFVPSGDRNNDSTAVRSPLQDVVGITALSYGKEISAGLIGWLAGVIEQPGKRFRTAERAGVFFTKTIATLSKSAVTRAMRARTQRVLLRQQIEAKGAAVGAGLGRPGPGAASAGLKTGRELDEYCRLWLRETAEHCTVTLLGFVQAQLEAFLEEISLSCRQMRALCDRLRPVLDSKQTQPMPRRAGLPLPSSAGALPGPGSPGEETLPAGLVQQFDRTFQGGAVAKMGWFRVPGAATEGPSRRAGDVARSTTTPDQLSEELLVRAREAMQGTIKGPDRARLFLRSQGAPERAAPLLRVRAEAARPKLVVSEGRRHWVVALPDGPSGETVNEMLREVLAGPPGSLVLWNDELLVCCEQTGCSLAAVTRALVGPEEVPADVVRSVMTRLIVPASASPPSSALPPVSTLTSTPAHDATNPPPGQPCDSGPPP